MTLLGIASWGGGIACVLIVAFIFVLVLVKRTKPEGAERVPDDAEHVISDAPPPDYPDGGGAS